MDCIMFHIIEMDGHSLSSSTLLHFSSVLILYIIAWLIKNNETELMYFKQDEFPKDNKDNK